MSRDNIEDIPNPADPESYLQGVLAMATAYDDTIMERGLQLLLETDSPANDADKATIERETINLHRRAGELALGADLKQRFEWIIAEARSIQKP